MSPEILQYGGLGLGILSLVLQISGGKPDTSSAKEILQLSQTAIQSARGTNICISWDCTGQPGEVSAPQVVRYQAQPHTAYVTTSGTPLPVSTDQEGQLYIEVATK